MGKRRRVIPVCVIGERFGGIAYITKALAGLTLLILLCACGQTPVAEQAKDATTGEMYQTGDVRLTIENRVYTLRVAHEPCESEWTDTLAVISVLDENEGLVQTLRAPVAPREERVVVLDINFDGYADFCMEYEDGAYNKYRPYWRWDQKLACFVSDIALQSIPNPQFDEQTKTITSAWRGSAMHHGVDKYRYVNGELKLLRQWKYDFAPNDYDIVVLGVTEARGDDMEAVFEAQLPYVVIDAIWEKQPVPKAYSAQEEKYRALVAEFDSYLSLESKPILEQ